MSESDALFYPPDHIQASSHVSSIDEYRAMHELSLKEPEKFWYDMAVPQFHWHKLPDKDNVLNFNFDVRKGPIHVEWFPGAKTNLCYNCLDRHILNGKGEHIAFQWEGNDPNDYLSLTYSDLWNQVKRFANVLKSRGLSKGDRVAIYMPMIPELVVSLLACSRIGVVHTVVFGGFSAEALAGRLIDAGCHTLLTCDGSWRGSKLIDLKHIADHAMDICKSRGLEVTLCVVVRHAMSPPIIDKVSGGGGFADRLQNSSLDSNETGPVGCRPTKMQVEMTQPRDVWWHDVVKGVDDICPVEWMEAEDPLFILYTSGSTGKPKGILHTTGGYMVYAATTFKYTFNHLPQQDIFWSTSDIGWITGHSYVVYGPLLNAASSILFEGIPTWPDAGRFWQIVERYSVSLFYTSPTALRALLRLGDEHVTKHSRKSLRVLGTVGEPINPDVWLWYHKVVGEERCAIVDTFWQTETGGHTITPIAGCTPAKPGSACLPFFGVNPVIIKCPEASESSCDLQLDSVEYQLNGPGEGYLVFKQPWPGIMRSVNNDHARFETTYFHKFPGFYCTGDGAKRDEDGYFWITGRIDDMLNVSGHLLSTAEIESCLMQHPHLAEAAVVSKPHAIKGECTYCFITVKDAHKFTDALCKELIVNVREKIGAFAAPDFIQEAPALPKTRSGKIMRRILRQIAVNSRELGDISTLADASVIDTLFALRVREEHESMLLF